MTNDNIHTFTYQFYGDDGMLKMQDVMKMLRHGLKTVGGLEVENIQELSRTLEYCLADGSHVAIRTLTGEPGSDPKADPRMEVTISVICADDDAAAALEARIRKDLESIIYMDHGMGYCCE